MEQGERQEVKDGLTRTKLAENICGDSYNEIQAGTSNCI